MADPAKFRREDIRWQILLTLNNARPIPANESLIISVVRASYQDVTRTEIRREMDYLADRELIIIDKRPDGVWLGDIGRYGVDVVEYTVSCEPGIARPEKYW